MAEPSNMSAYLTNLELPATISQKTRDQTMFDYLELMSEAKYLISETDHTLLSLLDSILTTYDDQSFDIAFWDRLSNQLSQLQHFLSSDLYPFEAYWDTSREDAPWDAPYQSLSRLVSSLADMANLLTDLEGLAIALQAGVEEHAEDLEMRLCELFQFTTGVERVFGEYGAVVSRTGLSFGEFYPEFAALWGMPAKVKVLSEDGWLDVELSVEESGGLAVED